MTGGFDARGFLDGLLQGGREIGRKGEDAAARGLGVGDDPASRAALRKGALGAAAGAAALSLLMGSKKTRKLASRGLQVGGIAALGKLAWDAWHSGGGRTASQAPVGQTPAQLAAPATPVTDPAPVTPVTDPAPVDELPEAAADARARLLLKAMIAAAKADGHVDERERAMILDKLDALGPEAQGFLFAELARPAGDPAALAAEATDPQARSEVYAVSVMVCDEADAMERMYLDRLATALDLPSGAAEMIELTLRGGA